MTACRTWSDFLYPRLHGDAQLYVSGYSDESLLELPVGARPAKM